VTYFGDVQDKKPMSTHTDLILHLKLTFLSSSKRHGNSTARRGGPNAAPLPAALNALERARNLRTSQYSLNPQGNKRKREFSDDEGDEESDNSPDAQLARTLQDEENRKVIDMVDEEDEELTPRRTQRARRTLRPILPKADYLSDLSDEAADMKFISSKKGVAIPSRSKKITSSIPDSDESAFDLSDDIIDSDDEFEEEYGARGRGSLRRNNVSHSTLPARVRSNAPQAGSMAATSIVNFRDAVLPSEDDDDDAAEDSDGFLLSALQDLPSDESESENDLAGGPGTGLPVHRDRHMRRSLKFSQMKQERRAALDRSRLESHHPELLTMWKDLEDLPEIKTLKAEQPKNISRELKPFQLEGLSWMKAMEKTEWGGGLLGDEMGMGKTIQAVSLIMSDYPAKNPSLVLIPPVALMQWQQEIGDYTDGTLKTFVFHGTNKSTKNITVQELKRYDVILMSYNSLESMYRHQEKGFKRKDSKSNSMKVHFEKSVIHKIQFHRVILDEAHNIKQRTTGVAKACFALKADHKWCLSGTPLQNRIGEFFSLVRFLDIRPFACYMCKQCPCSTLEWSMNAEGRCSGCTHSGMQHVSVFNQELLNPIVKYGNKGLGKTAFAKLRLLTNRFMLRRVKRDHSSAMELPAKEIRVDRQFFSEVENDFAGSIMNNNVRKFDTYVAEGVLLNNYANIFGLIMQMRQVADHPDLILKKHGDGGQNILVCCICDDPAEDAIRSQCRHDFCRTCAKNYLNSMDEINTSPDCPQCHIPLSIDLEQPEMEQDEQMVKKSSIINRIKMEKWTSSTKIETLVYDLHALRSKHSSTKSIIFSQFTTMASYTFHYGWYMITDLLHSFNSLNGVLDELVLQQLCLMAACHQLSVKLQSTIS
jgi:DNA repair protein RAD16